MTDYDAQIAAKRSEAERVRRDVLPPLADALCVAAAAWASTRWDEIIRSAIADQPQLAKDHQDQLPQLKEALESLRATAESDAHDYLRPWLLHESPSDETLVSHVQADRPGHPRVSLPSSASPGNDEPLRRLIGSIGPALDEAGLVTTDTAVTRDGRFRFYLDVPAEVNSALSAYDERLKQLAMLVHEARELELSKARSEAESLWDDA